MRSDREKVRRLKDGSMEARDSLIEDLLPLVKYLAGRYIHRLPYLADEITSAALEDLVKRLEQIRLGKALLGPDNIDAYINTTTIWAIKKAIHQKVKPTDEYTYLQINYSINRGPVKLELEEAINRGTTPKEQHVLELRSKGYSQQDIAEMLGLSQSSVSIILRRIV